MPTSAPRPTALITCDLVKISASGPMPTSKYCDQTPWAIRASLSLAAWGEPGMTWLRSSPITATTSRRMASDLAASPRACSSMTRSNMLATKVTPAALMACKSQGAMNQGTALSRFSWAELASTTAVLNMGDWPAVPLRTALAGSGNWSNWLLVLAMPERS